MGEKYPSYPHQQNQTYYTDSETNFTDSETITRRDRVEKHSNTASKQNTHPKASQHGKWGKSTFLSTSTKPKLLHRFRNLLHKFANHNKARVENTASKQNSGSDLEAGTSPQKAEKRIEITEQSIETNKLKDIEAF